MIDNYLLEELVTFADTGTLAKTAEKLLVTQPTVTRGMQKLEDQLGVKLFNRQPNRISLTKVGQLAAKEAQKAIDANNTFVNRVQNFAQTQRTIKIGSIAPGPLLIARKVAAQFPVEIDNQFVDQDDVANDLINHQHSLIFTDQEIQSPQIESLYLGEEQLIVNLDQFMYQANQRQIHFQDLKGITFVVEDNIGPWKEIIQAHIPEAKFLYQQQRDALREITKFSNFPFFSTNVTSLTPVVDHDHSRVAIPIVDKDAKMTFYGAYLKANASHLRPLLGALVKGWPAIPKAGQVTPSQRPETNPLK